MFTDDCRLNHSLWLHSRGQLKSLSHCACKDFTRRTHIPLKLGKCVFERKPFSGFKYVCKGKQHMLHKRLNGNSEAQKETYFL